MWSPKTRVTLYNKFNLCPMVKIYRLLIKISFNLLISGTFVFYLVYKLKLWIRWRDLWIVLREVWSGLFLINFWMFFNPINSRWSCMECHLLIWRNGGRIPRISNLIVKTIRLLNGFGKLWKLLIKTNWHMYCTSAPVLQGLRSMDLSKTCLYPRKL